MNYIQLRDAILLYKKDSKNNVNPYITLRKDFIEVMLEQFAKISLIRNEETNKVNAKATFMAVEDEYKIALIQIAAFGNRSNFLKPATAGKAPRYAGLTPLFMCAHKLEHGVMYNDWERKDGTAMKMALGELLFTKLITNNLPELSLTMEDRLNFRNARQKPDSSYLAWNCGVQASLPNNLVLKPTNHVSHMIAQTWIANAELRDPETMILDPWDWDLVPEALDIEIPSIKKENKKEEEALWVC